MMRFKKLFAGVAAAATLLGGMALGAGTATAAEGDELTLDTALKKYPALSVQSEPGDPSTVQGHKFTALRLGWYRSAIEGATPEGANGTFAKSVDVGTDATTAGGATQDTRTIMNDILKTIDEDPKTDGVQNGYAGSEYETDNNPMGYIVANYAGYGTTAKDTTSATKPWSGLLRDFVTKLAANDDIKKMIAVGHSDYYNIYSNDPNATDDPRDFVLDENTQTATAYIKRGYKGPNGIAGVMPGVYLIIDTTDPTALPMFTGTKLSAFVGNHYDFVDVLGNYNEGLDLGNVVVKSNAVKTSKKVALENADGTLAGDYATEVTAPKGQLVRYQLTSEVPAKGFESYPGEDSWATRFVDLPAKGQTALIKGGTNPTDDDGNVLFEGTVPGMKVTFNYENADGTTGSIESLKSDNLWKVKQWKESGNFAPVDGNIQTAELGAWDVDYLVADGKAHLYLGMPSWKFINEQLPEGAHWTTAVTEYSAVITADSGDVANAFKLFTGDSYDAGGMTPLTKDATSTVHVEKKSTVTQLPLTGAAGIALFGVIAAALLGAGAFGAVRMRRQASAGRSVRA